MIESIITEHMVKKNEEQNGIPKNTGKIIGLDLIFLFLTYLIGLSLNRFLGMAGDPENFEKGNPLMDMPLVISSISLLYFALIDGLLLLDKKIDRRILIFSGILIFLILILEVLAISNWILFFYKMFWMTTADLEADRLNGMERMRSDIQQIISGTLFVFAVGKMIVRIIWNSFWVRAILYSTNVT
ncbi:hypothetical protein [Leptospira stimsonii]|uniref:Uncharacterized protein n=1 Tax=Leptospira stimsonii TaxID=2202203 RepID=A0ABY2N0Z1_9LEPT|nr:hypothetical protein [Leptospira stimsonii]TGK19740.1 hypothetical protein EHO98_10665 [Leptospira stimsonii]TGM13739.1 hypothetical protein EHQ90_13060 [Leptospira stimsonii]